MFHIINLIRRALYCAWYARVSPCPTGEILEVRPRLVLVALQTVVETAVGLVVRLGGDVAEEADLEALLLRVEDVELPDGDAGRGEAKSHQAVVHQRGGHGPEEAAHPRVVREILTDVDAKVLKTGASPTVPRVGHRKAIGLALLLCGEVGQVVLQVVGRGIALLRPLH